MNQFFVVFDNFDVNSDINLFLMIGNVHFKLLKDSIQFLLNIVLLK